MKINWRGRMLPFFTSTMAVLLTATSALAATSGGGFVPLTTTDAPWIQHTGLAVYNADGVNTRIVTASTGVVALNPGVRNFGVYGRNNGLTLRCDINLFNTATGAIGVGAGNTTSVNGWYVMTISVPAQAAGTWMYNLVCQIPHTNGTSSDIYGVQ